MANEKKDKKAENGNMSAERKRIIALSDELLGLTTVPAMKTLSPKKHDKLLRQLDKVDRSVAKITKIVRAKAS